MVTRLIRIASVAFVLSSGVVQAQGLQSFDGGGANFIEAPEFDAKSTGAALALLLGGSLVLLETRRRRKSRRS